MPHILVDGHVHIHSCFRLEDLLASALRNFHAAEEEIQATRAARFLLLTESAGAGVFSSLQAKVSTDQSRIVTGFRIEPTEEAETLVVRDSSGVELYLVAGRQIVTAERLEVLALGYVGSFPDGLAIDQVLSRLSAADTSTEAAASTSSCRPLSVLPWGAGKWLGQRGQKVEQLVAQASARSFFLGDNGNRPFFWPLPALFKTAQSRAIHNLPGSDPLPFPGQEMKVGSFGLHLSGTPDPQAPFSSLRDLLLNPGTSLTPYGRCERLYPFFKHQISMQLHKKSSASF